MKPKTLSIMGFALVITILNVVSSGHSEAAAFELRKAEVELSGTKGTCDYPDQSDSRGRRCGRRAASCRSGGRLGSGRCVAPNRREVEL
jgi:hypothetical protein